MNRIVLKKDSGTIKLIKHDKNINLVKKQNTIKFQNRGLRGLQGMSAYEVAVSDGFVGTEAEWLGTLTGDKTLEVQLNGETDTLITHNLNKFPSVTVFTSAGDEVEGDYQFPDKNNTRLMFSAGFSGKAIFN